MSLGYLLLATTEYTILGIKIQYLACLRHVEWLSLRCNGWLSILLSKACREVYDHHFQAGTLPLPSNMYTYIPT